MTMTTDTPCLTPAQIDEYFTRIHLPKQYHRDQCPALTINFLTTLQSYHLTGIPYENLSLHYTSNVNVSLNIHDIHAKLVQRRRGGYCMENNILLYHVLRFLGFSVYMTGARLFRGPERKASGWSGWEHAINLVTLPDQGQYVVDVGYGGNGCRCPLRLIDGPVTDNIGTQTVRLLRGTLPGSTSAQSGAVWMYQFRMADDQPWTPAYAFTEVEFFFRDFEVMNFFTSRSKDCFLTSQVLVVLFTREGDKVSGKMVVDHDKVKKLLKGRVEVIREFKTEEERIEGLRHHFGIELTVDEQAQGRLRPSSLS